jgi:CyaY protein
MNKNDFLEQYDHTLRTIEDIIDNQSEDLDYENQAGMLTIFCPNGSQIIISRQSALSELWLAAKHGGFHFKYTDGQWQSTRDKLSFNERLSESIALQSGEIIKIEL